MSASIVIHCGGTPAGLPCPVTFTAPEDVKAVHHARAVATRHGWTTRGTDHCPDCRTRPAKAPALDEPLHSRAADEIRDQLRAAALPAPVRDLLAAIADSLDLPLPGLTERDEEEAARLMRVRARRIHNAARLILDEGHTVTRSAEWIREMTVDTPVNYTPWKRR